jgi:nucleotide-binding universal stress UspA family protein
VWVRGKRPVKGRTARWTADWADRYGRAVTYRKIVAGTDGSPPSLECVREAARLARAAGAELVVLCAYAPIDQATIERWKAEAPEEIHWRFTPGSLAEGAVDAARRVAEEEGATARGRIEVGEPAEAIIRVAEDEGADLIVVGSRGMTGPSRFLLGSVPNKVSHNAPCDLLIVKTVP